MQNEKKSTFSDIISEKVLFFNLSFCYYAIRSTITPRWVWGR